MQAKIGSAIQTTAAIVGIAGFLGFWVDVSVQNVHTLGLSDVLLGARMGLAGMDWTEAGRAAAWGAGTGAAGAAAWGAGTGAAGAAVVGACRALQAATSSISDKLAHRRETQQDASKHGPRA